MQASLKQGQYEDAKEWCCRALFVEETCVKALFRRALAHRATGSVAAALADLRAALSVEPHNEDLARELRACDVRSLEIAVVLRCSPPYHTVQL